MELRTLLQTLLPRWWIILGIAGATLAATAYFTLRQPPTYLSTATYVVRLGTEFTDSKDLLTALDTVSRRSEIATTYSEVANSRYIEESAATALGLSSAALRDFSVNSQLIPGTNVLRITGRGTDPEQTRLFTDAVGMQTALYVQRLYETYTLEPLDRATTRRRPVAPDVPLNLALGSVAGLLLGGVVALLHAYLREVRDPAQPLPLLDLHTGLFDSRYFRLRLQQEVSRSQQRAYPLAIAMLRLDFPGRERDAPDEVRHLALQAVAELLQRTLRPEEIAARWNDETLALLLPDLDGAQAARLATQLCARAEQLPTQAGDSALPALRCSAATQSHEPGLQAEEMISRALYGLVRVESQPDGEALRRPSTAAPGESLLQEPR